LSGQLVVAPVVKASRGQVQDELLHDDGDKAVAVVPNALDEMMGDGYLTCSIVPYSTMISLPTTTTMGRRFQSVPAEDDQ